MTSLETIKQTVEKALLNIEGVTGVGFRQGCEECIRVYVEKKTPEIEEKIPGSIGGYPVDVVETGKIRFLQDIATESPSYYGAYIPRDVDRLSRHRPYFGGISVGHFEITAGTLATRVYDASSGQKLILSNNHVFANSNNADVGDGILQPGKHDGGIYPDDIIADLRRFVPMVLKADGENKVDAAVAQPIFEDECSDDILDIGVVNKIITPKVGTNVKKSGRTTGITEGTIDDIDATVIVTGKDGEEWLFVDQIVVTTPFFLQGGDSGSLLCTEKDDETHAVGLCFAASEGGEISVANKITNVCSELGIKFSSSVSPVVVNGVVLDSETRGGIVANIECSGVHTTSNHNGEFSMGFEVAGEYTFNVSAPGYVSSSLTAELSVGENDVLILMDRVAGSGLATVLAGYSLTTLLCVVPLLLIAR